MMTRMHWIDTAVAVVGPLSFLSLIGFFLALHDIWWDYASPAVWARTKVISRPCLRTASLVRAGA